MRLKADAYPKTPGYEAGSKTSKQAAMATFPLAAPLRVRILDHLFFAGGVGLTCKELKHKLGAGHSSCSARLREAVLREEVVVRLMAWGDELVRDGGRVYVTQEHAVRRERDYAKTLLGNERDKRVRKKFLKDLLSRLPTIPEWWRHRVREAGKLLLEDK